MMKTIKTTDSSRLMNYLPMIMLGLLSLWKYKSYGYNTASILKSSYQGYFKMSKAYKGKNKEKRVNQMMLLSKNELLNTN